MKYFVDKEKVDTEGLVEKAKEYILEDIREKAEDIKYNADNGYVDDIKDHTYSIECWVDEYEDADSIECAIDSLEARGYSVEQLKTSKLIVNDVEDFNDLLITDRISSASQLHNTLIRFNKNLDNAISYLGSLPQLDLDNWNINLAQLKDLRIILDSVNMEVVVND